MHSGEQLGYRIKSNNIACTMSHIKALMQAKENGWHSVLIFEDDFAIKNDFDVNLANLLSNAPNGWDMIYLNGTYGKFSKPIKANEYFNKIGELYSTFAYIINARFYDKAIETLERFKIELDTDYIYSRLMVDNNIYRSIKPIVFHHGGYSYRAERKETNYKHLLP